MSEARSGATGAAEDIGPGYWMHETSGELQPAIEAYLAGAEMTPEHVRLMRKYLRQWIEAPAWHGPEVKLLRATTSGLTSRRNIDRWLDHALDAGIDPL